MQLFTSLANEKCTNVLRLISRRKKNKSKVKINLYQNNYIDFYCHTKHYDGVTHFRPYSISFEATLSLLLLSFSDCQPKEIEN